MGKYGDWVYVILTVPELHDLRRYLLIPHLWGQSYPLNTLENASQLVEHLALKEVAEVIDLYRSLGIRDLTLVEFVKQIFGDDIQYVLS